MPPSIATWFGQKAALRFRSMADALGNFLVAIRCARVPERGDEKGGAKRSPSPDIDGGMPIIVFQQITGHDVTSKRSGVPHEVNEASRRRGRAQPGEVLCRRP